MTIDLKALRRRYEDENFTSHNPDVVALIDWVERVKPHLEQLHLFYLQFGQVRLSEEVNQLVTVVTEVKK